MKESLQKDFTDDKGNENTVIIEGNSIKLPTNKKYKLQHETKKAKKGLFTSDIGVNSNGFAGIFGLATILAIAALSIAYIIWKL